MRASRKVFLIDERMNEMDIFKVPIHECVSLLEIEVMLMKDLGVHRTSSA